MFILYLVVIGDKEVFCRSFLFREMGILERIGDKGVFVFCSFVYLYLYFLRSGRRWVFRGGRWYFSR